MASIAAADTKMEATPALATLANSVLSFFRGETAQEEGLEAAPAVAVRRDTVGATVAIEPVNLGGAADFTILAKVIRTP